MLNASVLNGRENNNAVHERQFDLGSGIGCGSTVGGWLLVG